MTDKQIKEVFKNGFYCIEPCLEIKELLAELKAKEQECEELKEDLRKSFEEKDILHLIIDRLLEASGYDTNTASAEDFEDVYEHMRYEQQQLDQLKAEVKSKTEYIQEQRDIINQYSKEIEMYKKCQGKRASKREEELKAENETYKKMLEDEEVILALNEVRAGERHLWFNKADKLKQTLTEIKEIVEEQLPTVNYNFAKSMHPEMFNCYEQILQKISEVEDG